MLILAFESSCDETAAAVSKDGRQILSDIVYSQSDMHALYGGVVPEIASRRHVEKISTLAAAALDSADITPDKLGAVAATCGPGLIGALLVGANFAKSVAMALNIPFVPVHHIRAHIAANYIAFPDLRPPFTALVVSGGHTMIIDVVDYTKMTVMGTTRDDAAGEAFDKTARLMGLPYPGGAALDKLSQGGELGKYKLPRAEVAGAPLDFSFSGLKTSAVNLLHNSAQKNIPLDLPSLAAEMAQAVADSIVPRVITAARQMGRNTICAAGGVAANSTLRSALERECAASGITLCLPPLSLCGDNGSAIATQAYYELQSGNIGALSQNCFATVSPEHNLSSFENN